MILIIIIGYTIGAFLLHLGMQRLNLLPLPFLDLIVLREEGLDGVLCASTSRSWAVHLFHHTFDGFLD